MPRVSTIAIVLRPPPARLEGGILDYLPDADQELLEAVETDYDSAETRARATTMVRAGWQASIDLRDALVRSIGADLRIVWIGGGGLNLLAQQVAPVVATSIVIDPSMVQLRRTPDTLGQEVVLARALAEDLPVVDDWADMTELQGVLDHVTDPELAIKHAVRATRPGGMVVVTLTNDASWFRRLARRFGGRGHGPYDHHAHRFSASQIHELVQASGLDRVVTETVMFLRLPRGIDRLPDGWANRVTRASDVVGRRLAARSGGITVSRGIVPMPRF